jgi:hypothetical protein
LDSCARTLKLSAVGQCSSLPKRFFRRAMRPKRELRSAAPHCHLQRE